MDEYIPFILNNWKTLGIFGASVALGAVIDRSRNISLPGIKQAENGLQKGPALSVQKRKESADDSEAETNEEHSEELSEVNHQHVVYEYTRPSEAESIHRSLDFYMRMNKRRSVRQISSDPVPLEVIRNIVKTAGW